MKRSVAFFCGLFSVVALTGCAGGSDRETRLYGAGQSRPWADATPANDVEAKARVHTDLGLEYLFTIGRPEAALDEARAAMKLQSGYPPAWHLMGLAYMALKQNSQAGDAFRNALRATPGDPDFNNSYGWWLCQQGKLKEALPRFAAASSNSYYAHKTRPFTNAGRCLLDNSDLDGAEYQFNQAISADSGNTEALYQLSVVAYRKGNYRRSHDLLIQYHQRFAPAARSVWLGLRAARRLGEGASETSYAEQLRSRFAQSNEYALLLQGKYE